MKLCPFCYHPVNWSQRDRISYGWYCPRPFGTQHPDGFYGYLGAGDVVDPASDPSVALRALRARFSVRIDMRVLYGSEERNPDGSYIKYYDVATYHKGDRKINADYWYLHTCGKSASDAVLQAAELLL